MQIHTYMLALMPGHLRREVEGLAFLVDRLQQESNVLREQIADRDAQIAIFLQVWT